MEALPIGALLEKLFENLTDEEAEKIIKEASEASDRAAKKIYKKTLRTKRGKKNGRSKRISKETT